jgi:arabinogalactan oligomer / maltooligosaccharide transport system substrate-binding protein
LSLGGGFGTLIWMKKPLIIVSSIVFLLMTFLYVFASNNGFRACNLDLDKVCFDEELKQYQIEENALLTIVVNDLEYGDALVRLWSQIHPEANAITYVLESEASNNDLMYLSQNDAALVYASLYLLDTNFINNVPHLSAELNLAGNTFLPLIGEGFAFITNKTELERLTGTWVDSNNNNLHDSYESYESIINDHMNWGTDKRKLVLSLNEPFTLYPFLTSNGWRIYEDYSSYYPGFEKESFLESLRFIELLSSVNWNQTESNLASNYTWEYPNVLFDDSFLFSQVATWMFVEEMDLKHESEWVISAFPKALETSKDALQTMLTRVEGYSINKDTLYPSAAHELLRIIYSTEGLQAKLTHGNGVVLSNKENLDLLSFRNDIDKQFAYAFLESQSEPLLAVEDYPSHLAIRLFYEIDLESTIQRLWDKEITVDEAQIEIALKSDAWIMKNSKMFEGKINHE